MKPVNLWDLVGSCPINSRTTISFRAVQEDGGLWKVWDQSEGDKGEDNPVLGYVWINGYSIEERRGEKYWALDDWVDGVEPGRPYAKCDTLEEALSVLCECADPIIARCKRLECELKGLRVPA